MTISPSVCRSDSGQAPVTPNNASRLQMSVNLESAGARNKAEAMRQTSRPRGCNYSRTSTKYVDERAISSGRCQQPHWPTNDQLLDAVGRHHHHHRRHCHRVDRLIGATHNDYKTAVELIMNVANDSLSLSDVSAALTHTHTHAHTQVHRCQSHCGDQSVTLIRIGYI